MASRLICRAGFRLAKMPSNFASSSMMPFIAIRVMLDSSLRSIFRFELMTYSSPSLRDRQF